jgi:hypothetical protein
VQTSSSLINRDLSLCLPMPTKLLALPPPIDAHQALGSPSGRAGAKRLRGITAPIPPIISPSNHCTDSTYNLSIEPLQRFHLQSIHRNHCSDSLYGTAFLHSLSARNFHSLKLWQTEDTAYPIQAFGTMWASFPAAKYDRCSMNDLPSNDTRHRPL